MSFHMAVRGNGQNEELLVLLHVPTAFASGNVTPPRPVLWTYA